MADLRIQLAYIGKHTLCRMQELDAVNLGKVVTLLLEVIVQSNAQVFSVTAKERHAMVNKLKVIWHSIMSSLRMICGQSELACTVLNKNSNRPDFAKSLISIAEYCQVYGPTNKELIPLLMDTLVVIGDLTASEGFKETTFFVENNLFSILKTCLDSPAISSLENYNVSSGHTGISKPNAASHAGLNPEIDLSELTKDKFQETIMWTIANAVADEQACQQVFLDKHSKLMRMCFELLENDNPKIKEDVCHMIDNLFMYEHIKRYLFGGKGK